ncbi:hypothetical protein FJY71_04060 [candidate division WOR-3 bacterium]|nr:hypothetical protein [candidate division WOR-3 bacterium]
MSPRPCEAGEKEKNPWKKIVADAREHPLAKSYSSYLESVDRFFNDHILDLTGHDLFQVYTGTHDYLRDHRGTTGRGYTGSLCEFLVLRFLLAVKGGEARKEFADKGKSDDEVVGFVAGDGDIVYANQRLPRLRKPGSSRAGYVEFDISCHGGNELKAVIEVKSVTADPCRELAVLTGKVEAVRAKGVAVHRDLRRMLVMFGERSGEKEASGLCTIALAENHEPLGKLLADGLGLGRPAQTEKRRPAADA